MNVIYDCIECHKIFIKLSLLERHKNNKKSCNIPKNIIKNINTKIKIFDDKSLGTEKRCYYCNNTFTRKDSLKRHIDYKCELKKKLIEQKEE